LCVIKKSRKRGGYSPARGLQHTNPQRVVTPGEGGKKGGEKKKPLHNNFFFCGLTA